MRLLRHPLVLVLVLLLLVAGGGILVLGAGDLPAPTKRVEKVIPGDRLPR
jgi:hypothetical protein